MTCPPHRFWLDSPNGPVVAGVCRLCGERRTWPASLETLEGAAAARRRGTMKRKEKVT